VRLAVALLLRALPQLQVLSHSGIPEIKTMHVTSLLGAQVEGVR
jgi:hypothetical protein